MVAVIEKRCTSTRKKRKRLSPFSRNERVYLIDLHCQNISAAESIENQHAKLPSVVVVVLEAVENEESRLCRQTS